MRFSAQEEYGMRCLLQIAREPLEGLTIPEIAGREVLTEAYVAKLVRVLRKAGIVTSTRGQKGGYRLSRSADQIRVSEALIALGGRLFAGDFCGKHTGAGVRCVHNVDCSIRSLWMALDAAVERTLSTMTLQDLLCSERDAAALVHFGGQNSPSLRPFSEVQG